MKAGGVRYVWKRPTIISIVGKIDFSISLGGCGEIDFFVVCFLIKFILFL
jgi:hypothetical protein